MKIKRKVIEIKTAQGVILGKIVGACSDCPCADFGDGGWGAHCQLAEKMGLPYLEIEYGLEGDECAIPNDCPLDERGEP